MKTIRQIKGNKAKTSFDIKFNNSARREYNIININKY